MDQRKRGLQRWAGTMAFTALALAAVVSGCTAHKGNAAAEQTAYAKVVVPVSVTKPQKKSAQGELSFNGTLHAVNEVKVVAETQGKVLAVFIDTGTRVSKGDVLVHIDDELKQASFNTAQAAYDKSKSDWNRAQDLFVQKVIADADRQGAKLAFANAESQLLMARRDLENAKVRAPLSGVVTQKFVSVGSMLAGGAPVANIVDADELKLTIQVGERDVLKIRPDMSVKVDSDLYPNVSFSGRVSAISPKGDSALTFPVEISLKNDPQRPLYDGMSAKARIGLGSRSILAIPRACIVGSFQAPQVYVVDSTGADGAVARLKSISIGGEYGTDVEVLKGLGENDVVVSGGVNNLSDGASVSVAEGVAR
jgi:membrane fusion protein, multidrug efflux system